MTQQPAHERGNTRRKLLDAAYRVLAEHGYEAATVKEIARVAGVAPGLVHYYFKDKDALLAAVLAEAATQHTDTMRDAMARLAGRDLLAAALAERKQRVVQQPEWYRLRYEFFALGLRNPAMLPGVAALLASGRSGIGNVVRALGSEEPAARPDDAEALAGVLLAALDGLGLQQLADPTFNLDAAYRVLTRLAEAVLLL